MDIFECIENDDLEEVKKLVESGINIYKTRESAFVTKKLSTELIDKYSRVFVDPNDTEILLTHTIVFCKSDEIANYLLDIYERDLEILKGTHFKKALVAMPEDQTEELLICCTFKIPSDEKYFEPVLLKKNNLEPPKLAFLSRKLKDINDKSLKFIHKLEKNGLCELDYKFSDQSSIICAFARADWLKVTIRLLISQFICNDEKESFKFDLLQRFFFDADISLYEYLFDDFIFDQSHIVHCAARKNVQKLKFIFEHMMKNKKCSLDDILKLECDIMFHNIKYDKSIVLHNIILSGLDEDLELEFDKAIFYPSNASSVNEFFKYWFDANANNEEKIKRFFEKHPKLLKLKSIENMIVLDYALKCGNPSVIKIIFELNDDKEIYIKDEARALKCFKVSNLYGAEPKEVTEIFKLLLHDNFESFVLKYGSKIIQDHDAYMKLHAAIYFHSMQFFKDSNFDITKLTYFKYIPIDKYINNIEIFDWNHADSSGETLFMNACGYYHDDPKFLKSIIAKQPDCVHKRTQKNSTCLHYVKNHQTSEIAKVLVEMGVDPQVKNDNNEKAIHLAICNLEVFSYLIQFESDEDLNKPYGMYLETYFNSVQVPDVMKVLLTRKIDVMALAYDGFPLILSSTFVEVAMVCINYIKEKKIDFDAKTKDKYGNDILLRSVTWPFYENPSLFRLVLKSLKNELDFKTVNCDGENFSHRILNLPYKVFFEYIEIVKEECLTEFTEANIDFKNTCPKILFQVIEYFNPCILIDKIIDFINYEKVFSRILIMHQSVLDFLTNNPSTLFLLIKNCNNEKSIEILLEKLNPEIFNNVFDGDKNILHVICEKNNKRMTENFLVFLTANRIKKFSNQVCDGKKPFDTLNQDLKFLFENVLKN